MVRVQFESSDFGFEIRFRPISKFPMLVSKSADAGFKSCISMKSSGLLNIAAAALIVIFSLQALLALPRLSATLDEVPHLASGYSYWKTWDFRMNPEHPPLAKLL